MRGLRSPFSDKYLEMETAGAPLEVLNKFATGCSRKVAEEGIGPDGMNGIVQVGQSLGRLNKIQPAAEIIQELMGEAEALLLHAPNLVGKNLPKELEILPGIQEAPNKDVMYID